MEPAQKSFLNNQKIDKMKRVFTLWEKIISLIKAIDQKMIEAADEAVPVLQNIQKWLGTDTALVIESFIPNGAAWGKDAQIAIQAAIPALQLMHTLGDNESSLAILQRLGSKITAIIHGGKRPFTYYVQAFEYVFGLNTIDITSLAEPQAKAA